MRDVAQVLVRAALAKPRRNLATTRRGALELFVARHFPALVDAIVESDFRRLIAAGHFANSEFAARFADETLRRMP